MKEALLTILRDEKTKAGAFREATSRLAELLAAEAALSVPLEKKTINTPLKACEGKYLKADILLVPILRAGLTLLPAFLKLFPDSKVGFLGIRRDEETAEPHHYYDKIPNLSGQEHIFLLDPMIATGGTAHLAITHLHRAGADLKKIHLIGIIAAKPGVERIKKDFPAVRLNIVATDPELDSSHYIVPGLGDFGDRYFIT